MCLSMCWRHVLAHMLTSCACPYLACTVWRWPCWTPWTLCGWWVYTRNSTTLPSGSPRTSRSVSWATRYTHVYFKSYISVYLVFYVDVNIWVYTNAVQYVRYFHEKSTQHKQGHPSASPLYFSHSIVQFSHVRKMMSVFEIIIRNLGGLLSAYGLSKKKVRHCHSLKIIYSMSSLLTQNHLSNTIVRHHHSLHIISVSQ